MDHEVKMSPYAELYELKSSSSCKYRLCLSSNASLKDGGLKHSTKVVRSVPDV